MDIKTLIAELARLGTEITEQELLGTYVTRKELKNLHHNEIKYIKNWIDEERALQGSAQPGLVPYGAVTIDVTPVRQPMPIVEPKAKKRKSKIELVAGMYEYFGNTDSQEIGNPFEESERKIQGRKGIECVYSDALAMQLDGKRDVPTPVGFIDVLTADQLIEVKWIGCWKHAVGQVLMYGLYHPLHQKRIHLFGDAKADQVNSISKWAGQSGILVTHEA